MALAENSTSMDLLHLLSDFYGKDVLAITSTGERYTGIFSACSPEMEIGLKYAYKITSENESNYLPRRKDVIEKIQFAYSDLISLSAILSEEKNVKGFATDRDYHSKHNGHIEDEELEAWECDEEGEEIESLGQGLEPRGLRNGNGSGGWSADAMFQTNAQFGVQSTFVADLSQYSTVPVVGTEEDRKRAEKIAQEIESSSTSKFNARLENDDVERDLDKRTADEEFEQNRRSGGGVSYNNRGGRGGSARGRGDGLKKDDRRGSNPQQRQYNSGSSYGSRGSFQGPKRDSHYESSVNKDRNTGSKVFESSKNNKVHLDLARPQNRSDKGSDGKHGRDRRIQGLIEFKEDFNYCPRADQENKEPSTSADHANPVRTAAPAPAGNAWNKGPPSSLLNSQSQQPTTSIPTLPPSSPASSELQTSGSGGEPSLNATSSADKEASVDQSVELPAESGSEADRSDDKNKDDSSSTAGSKKFSFNVNAPVFTPRQAPTTPTPTMPVQQAMPPMTAVPVVHGGIPPPGMVHGQQIMMQSWQGQNYTPMPYIMAGQQVVMPVSQPRTGAPNHMQYAPNNARRSNGPSNQPVMVSTQQQWGNAMVVQPPMIAYPYANAGGPPPFSGTPQMLQPQPQQGMQIYRSYQTTPYVMHQATGMHQQRFPTPQQHPNAAPGVDGNIQYSNQAPLPSAANSTANSQPPTPGPQQPQPVPSPAQQHPPAPPSGRASPLQQPSQQFVHAPPTSGIPPHVMQHQPFYQPNMYFQPQMMYVNSNQMPPVSGAMSASEPHHVDNSMMQPNMSHQQYSHDQYGNYMQGGAGGPTGYYAQQPMSRQNSIPQNYVQGAPGLQQPPQVPPPQGPPSHAQAPPAAQQAATQ